MGGGKRCEETGIDTAQPPLIDLTYPENALSEEAHERPTNRGPLRYVGRASAYRRQQTSRHHGRRTLFSNDGRIATEKRGHIFLIVIDRPKKLNGFSAKMLSELGQAFSAMEDDPDIRCGVLCAEGRNFTAGLELNQIAEYLAEGPLFPADKVDPVNVHGRVRSKPLVSALQGICLGPTLEVGDRF